MKKIKVILIILLFFQYINNSYSAAINIYGGNEDLIDINIPIITGDKFSSRNIAYKINKNIKKQLYSTKIFSIANDKASSFEKLNEGNPQNFYYGELEIHVKKNIYNSYDADIIFYDHIHQKNIFKENYQLQNKHQASKIAALISDKIFKYYTGINGYQNTKILYISEHGSALKRKRKLAIKNIYDDDISYLNIKHDLILSPRFNPNGKNIVYLAYQNNLPQLFIYDLKKKESKKLLKDKKLNFAPRFSKDGTMLAYSSSFEGNSEIMIYNFINKKKTRLTNHPAIDTSPDFSPDNKTIIFSSDRDGAQKLYLLDIETKKLKKINFTSGNYSTPRWSPDGKYITYTKTHRGKSHIGIVNMNNLEVKNLTKSYKDDTPSWAPNSKFIIFTRMNPKKSNIKSNYSNLYITNLNGDIIKKIKTDNDASDADWIEYNN